ncbi:MAG: hypothetical protein ACUVRY_10160 [Thermoanaerobaculaceae bacterium]
MTEIFDLPASEVNPRDVFWAPDATGLWSVFRERCRPWHEGAWEGPVVLGGVLGRF